MKERLDVLLVKRNLAETREKAKRLIMAGQVFSENNRMDKAGVKVDETIPLTVKGSIRYVSRGGFKLEKALEYFNLDVTGRTMLDIGSSTGGFTDCALQNGVDKVYAIDVGYNQLDWKLRSDPRVIVSERTNFRHVTADFFTEGLPNFSSIDVSFISLRIILPVLKKVLQKNSDVVALIKPQFEANREDIGKKGVIRDKKVHRYVLKEIVSFAESIGFHCANLTYSPITGGEGNIEFLAHLTWEKDLEEKSHMQDKIDQVIEEAHIRLK